MADNLRGQSLQDLAYQGPLQGCSQQAPLDPWSQSDAAILRAQNAPRARCAACDSDQAPHLRYYGVAICRVCFEEMEVLQNGPPVTWVDWVIGLCVVGALSFIAGLAAR